MKKSLPVFLIINPGQPEGYYLTIRTNDFCNYMDEDDDYIKIGVAEIEITPEIQKILVNRGLALVEKQHTTALQIIESKYRDGKAKYLCLTHQPEVVTPPPTEAHQFPNDDIPF